MRAKTRGRGIEPPEPSRGRKENHDNVMVLCMQVHSPRMEFIPWSLQSITQKYTVQSHIRRTAICIQNTVVYTAPSNPVVGSNGAVTMPVQYFSRRLYYSLRNLVLCMWLLIESIVPRSFILPTPNYH